MNCLVHEMCYTNKLALPWLDLCCSSPTLDSEAKMQEQEQEQEQQEQMCSSEDSGKNISFFTLVYSLKVICNIIGLINSLK